MPNPEKNTLNEIMEGLNNIRKNLLRLYRKQTWKIPHVIMFPVVFVYYEILLRIFSEAPFFTGFLYLIIFGAGAGFLCSAVTSLFKSRINRKIDLALLYLSALIFVVECLIRESYQVYMTFGTIFGGAGDVMGGFVKELVSSILHGIPKIILFFLPALLYTATGKRRVPARRYPPVYAAALLIVALLLNGVGAIFAANGKHGPKYTDKYEITSATNTFGLLTSLRLGLGRNTTPAADFVVEETEETTAPPTETQPIVYDDNVMNIDFTALAAGTSDEDVLALHSYASGLTPSKQNEYTGLFKGKNLILICAEAFSDAVIHKELTPTLYRMAHNGFYFSNYYQPTWGGSTSSGEYSMLFGLVPMDGTETMQYSSDNNNYFTLGNQLQRLGYSSVAYHDGDHDYYDRHLTHQNLGYEKFLGIGNGLEDIAGAWTGDKVMFDTTMNTYMDSQPFSVYYMTVDGHAAYKSDDALTLKYIDRVRAVYGDKYKETTLNYLCYQMGLEDALTTMIAKLEEKGIADDTVICLTSDHYPYGLAKSGAYGNEEDYVADLYGYPIKYSWDRDRNGLLIWSGCLENENKDMACEISAPTYSLDIVPTLSNLFGLEYDSRLLVGRDVFSNTEPLALWNNYSWVTEKGRYDSESATFFPNEGQSQDEAYVERINQIVTNKIRFSAQTLYNDYYAELFGPDLIS